MLAWKRTSPLRRVGRGQMGSGSILMLLAVVPCLLHCSNNADDCELTLCSSDSTGGQSGTGGGATGGGGGTGNTGGFGTTTECLPENVMGGIAAECGIFVDADASDGDGTQASPYSTIGEAVAASSGEPIYVCASGAGHAEAVVIDASMDLFGGFSCTSWEVRDDKVAWTAAAGEIPLHISGEDTELRVEGFAIVAIDADAPGGSSIAMLVRNATVEISAVDLTAGRGAAGGQGATPAGTGTVGAPGVNGSPSSAGNGGQRTCGTATVSGGKGGFPELPFLTGSGAPGMPQPMGTAPVDGLGGIGSASPNPCATGHDGAAGTSGTAGPGATGVGALSASGYGGPSGAAGSAEGKPGQGGGGGGSDTTNALGGGGGGSGGCGGALGEGGTAGGSSIALALVDAVVRLNGVGLTASSGGAGGVGSAGQVGGAGGAKGGGVCNGNLCAAGLSCGGGTGGSGGRGGAGGGGLGGHSAGILYGGEAPTETDVTVTLGTAGAGGLGGDGGAGNQGGAGAVGQASERLWLGA